MTVNLSGTITDSVSGLPLEGVTVDTTDPATSDLIDSTMTASDGTYSIDAAPATVKLYFILSGYYSLWYGGTDFDSATPINLVDVPVVIDATLVSGGVTPPPPPTGNSGFALGSISPIWVGRASAFTRPSFVTRVPLLSDGTGAVSESLQSGSLPRRAASWDLPWVEDADLATLQGYFDAAAQVSCTDPAGTRTVVILDLPEADMVAPGLWSLSGLVMVEI